MNVRLVTEKLRNNAGTSAEKCPLCRRSVRVGQYVLHHRLAPAAFADTTLMIHVACLRPIVDQTPEDEADPSTVHQEFLRISRLLASG